MPESFTPQDTTDIEMYKAALSDGIITEKERSMLEIQATAYGFSKGRVEFLEASCREPSTEEE